MKPSHTGPKAMPKVDKFVAYYRVSTARQGRSGLGLEAQQGAVQGYLKGISGRLLAEYTEVESGKRNDRPKLQEAIHRAKVTGSRLIIAKMDRLSRNAAFLLTLRDSGVRFVAADLPNADETVVGIMAVVAQNETGDDRQTHLCEASQWPAGGLRRKEAAWQPERREGPREGPQGQQRGGG